MENTKLILLIFILSIFSILIFPLTSADYVSFNAGGDTNFIISANDFIEGFNFVSNSSISGQNATLNIIRGGVGFIPYIIEEHPNLIIYIIYILMILLIILIILILIFYYKYKKEEKKA